MDNMRSADTYSNHLVMLCAHFERIASWHVIVAEYKQDVHDPAIPK